MVNSEKKIVALVDGWKAQGMTKSEVIVNTAEAEVGWCYVWGAVGQQCTPSNRRAYAARSSCPSGESAEILATCPVTHGTSSGCSGCKWFPGDERTLMDDCQGFIKQTAGRVGIKFAGGGCTSMWNAKANWSEQGTIDTLPERLCCVFWQNQKDHKTMEHIGWYIGNGMMIHCSGSVKKEKLSKKCTHWAIPAALAEDGPDTWPTLSRGSKGYYVTQLQTMLIKRGYSLPRYGADGDFGAETEAAVKKFQADNGLEPDGVAGPITIEKLREPEELYTVTLEHLSRSVADEIVKKYGGSMKKENI